MRNTAEYEAHLTNPLEDRYPEEPTPTCDECSEPHDEQEWCGECGCCRVCCKNEYVGCMPASMVPMTLTVYLHVDINDNPDSWDIGAMFDDVNVTAWNWQDGLKPVLRGVFYEDK